MKMLNYTAAAFLVALVFYLLIVGQSLLLPLVIALALWYLVNTLARGFHSLHIAGFRFPMPLCLVASFLTFCLLIWGLVNFLSSTWDEVVAVAPRYQSNLTTRLESVSFIDMAEFQNLSLTQLITDWIDLPSMAGTLATSFANVLASGGLILIYLGFLFLEQGHFTSKVSALLANKEKEEEAFEIMGRIRNDIQKYISIKVLTSSLTGILSYGFLMVAGVDFAGVWGLLIFLLNFIPTVGSIIATIFPALIALAQSEGYTLFLTVLAGIGVVQICIGNILEPRMMGSSFNLSPVVILLNLALWNQIWGVWGMFLCVPLLIIVAIVLSHFPQTRPVAVMLSTDGRLRVPIDKTLANFGFGSTAKLLPTDSTEQESDG